MIVYVYLRATIICGYKFLEIVRLAGTHFSKFSKLTFYLFEKVENLNTHGYNFLAKIGQIANCAKFSTHKQKCPKSNRTVKPLETPD